MASALGLSCGRPTQVNFEYGRRVTTPLADNESVIVVDDDVVLRRVIGDALQQSGFATTCYGCAEDVVAAADIGAAACVVSDVSMPGMSGVELQCHLAQRFPRLPVILVTGYADVAMAVQAMKNGAFDFIEKPFDPDALVERVRAAAATRSNGTGVSVGSRLARRVSQLTPRELDVFQALAAGKSYKEIARDLAISVRTVEHHREHIAAKLQAKTLAELVRIHTHWLLARVSSP